MTDPTVFWTAPAPFWEARTIDPATAAQALGRPEILRFANDDFMDEILTVLAHDPYAIRNLAVRHETWRGPEKHPTGIGPESRQDRKPGLAMKLARKRAVKMSRAAANLPAGKKSGDYELKLYQPAHQRYYLVCTSLVCGMFGFPDRLVNSDRQERVSFVLRRLLPKEAKKLQPTEDLPLYDPAQPQEWEEYAFVPRDVGGQWHKADQPGPLAGEERLPLFPLKYCTGEERRRRLLAGLIPVGRREAYMSARPVVPTVAPDEKEAAAPDPRWVLLQTKVLAPWKALVDRVGESPAEWLEDKDGNPNPDAITEARAQIQTATWYILLDLAEFLETHVKDVWTVIAAATGEPSNEAQRNLCQALKDVALPETILTALAGESYPASSVSPSLAAALKSVVEWREHLEKVKRPFDFTIPSTLDTPRWPDFLFVLADPWEGAVLPALEVPAHPNETLTQKHHRQIDALGELFKPAFDSDTGAPTPIPTAAAAIGIDMRDGWFVLRCIYERPECGPLQDVVVSQPTRAFRLAAFFDPDAPARPVRIGLPIDTTPAGLRKFDKNAVFMMSDILCGQVSRMKGLTLGDLVRHVLPFPLHKGLGAPKQGPCQQADGLSLGMMCSLSIPIITLCALILLMIMVNLLDFIFRWLPYFLVCFPLPGFKGKKE